MHLFQPHNQIIRWLIEDRSISTRTNALFSLQMIQQQQQQQQGGAEEGRGKGSQPGGWHSIVLVTNPFHQLRSYHTFKHAMQEMGLWVADEAQGGAIGYRLYVAAAPFAGHRGYGAVLDAAADQFDFWRELAALAWYWLRGWL